MRIATVVGARPQFIKAVLVSKALRKKHEEILIHTGQHYNREMSQLFFDELKLPEPDYRLGVGPGSPAWQLGAMLVKLDKILAAKKPDLVIVYGDTTSTLAGALAAAKRNIPLAHVEAGLRSFQPAMQEEKNRIITDRLSRLLLCPTRTAVANLKNEGIRRGVHLTGDVMADSLNYFLPAALRRSKILAKLDLESKKYFLATIHRAENTDDAERLKKLAKILSSLPFPVVLPLHPRTQKELQKHRIRLGKNIHRINPVGYFDMLALEKNARIVLTDSGGVQKEAYLLRVPCVTLREETEWVETVESRANILAGYDIRKVHRAVDHHLSGKLFQQSRPFGTGNAIRKISKILANRV